MIRITYDFGTCLDVPTLSRGEAVVDEITALVLRVEDEGYLSGLVGDAGRGDVEVVLAETLRLPSEHRGHIIQELFQFEVPDHVVDRLLLAVEFVDYQPLPLLRQLLPVHEFNRSQLRTQRRRQQATGYNILQVLFHVVQ